MIVNNTFYKIFKPLPILGMIHLASSKQRALEELAMYEEQGVDGAIIENYHGSVQDIEEILKQAKTNLVLGVNVLPNEFKTAFRLADQYGAKFVQLDYVAGRYHKGTLDANAYNNIKRMFPEIVVLGGVWPKYYIPHPESNISVDLKQGSLRAEAIVVTGQGTGEETPLEKIVEFRTVLRDHPLIIGAGLTTDNAYEQLQIADGAIVGSFFKHHKKTSNIVDPTKVKALMDIVKQVREEKLS